MLPVTWHHGHTGVLESRAASASRSPVWRGCPGVPESSAAGRGEHVYMLEPSFAKELLLAVITGPEESAGWGLSRSQATQLRFHIHK